MTDPIANMLTSLRNAYMVKKTVVVLPYSKMKEALVKILIHEGYLEKMEITKVDEVKKNLTLTLRYSESKPALMFIRRVSKPGRRWYAKKDELPTILGGLGTAILSTSQGLMTVKDARAKGLGGEIICEIA